MCCEHLRFLLYIFDAAEAFTSATYNNNNTHKQLYAQIIICTKKIGCLTTSDFQKQTT